MNKIYERMAQLMVEQFGMEPSKYGTSKKTVSPAETAFKETDPYKSAGTANTLRGSLLHTSARGTKKRERVGAKIGVAGGRTGAQQREIARNLPRGKGGWSREGPPRSKSGDWNMRGTGPVTSR